MPKPYTFPTLYNEALQIHISKLKGWDYLEPNQVKSGAINWSRNENPTATPATPAPAPTAPVTTAPVTPERPTENKKVKQQDAIQPDQTEDMIIQPRTDCSEAEIIQAIERIDKGSNGRERLNRLIDEGKLHRCKITKAIYYVPF